MPMSRRPFLNSRSTPLLLAGELDDVADRLRCALNVDHASPVFARPVKPSYFFSDAPMFRARRCPHLSPFTWIPRCGFPSNYHYCWSRLPIANARCCAGPMPPQRNEGSRAACGSPAAGTPLGAVNQLPAPFSQSHQNARRHGRRSRSSC
jgi:hypothetical protein